MLYSNKKFSAEVAEILTERTVTLRLTAPASEWARIRSYLGEASTQTPFEFYDVLTNALDEAEVY